MRFLIPILLLPLLTTGCYFKEFNLINNNGYRERVFENLYQGGVWSGIDLKATIKAVYMNDVDKKSYHSDEIFFISLYIFDELEDPDRQGLNNPLYTLSLNGQRPYRIDEVKEDSELYQKMTITTSWFRNYLVYFYPVDSENLQLKLEHSVFGSTEMVHIKGSGEKRDYPTVVEKLQRVEESK